MNFTKNFNYKVIESYIIIYCIYTVNMPSFKLFSQICLFCKKIDIFLMFSKLIYFTYTLIIYIFLFFFLIFLKFDNILWAMRVSKMINDKWYYCFKHDNQLEIFWWVSKFFSRRLFFFFSFIILTFVQSFPISLSYCNLVWVRCFWIRNQLPLWR